MKDQKEKPCLKWAWIVIPVVVLGLQIRPGRPEAQAADGGSPARGDRALIVVGLAGDDEHAALFRETALAWRRWLTDSLEFPSGGVRVLFGERGEPSLDAGPASRRAVTDEVATIRRTLAPEGRLWVFFLGHANRSEGHVFLHLPGPDLREDELGTLVDGIKCREQVFWCTTSASGWFLPALSAAGRIVITATAPDQEFNETEFPHVLAELSRRRLAELDQDRDGKVSVWELFILTAQAVEDRFASDHRVPTEHPQLDDNGDRRGSERPQPVGADSQQEKTAKRESRDGELARKTFLRLKVEKSPSPH
ncbi:MAG TPA: hypothetical protein VKA15_10655 [Isosphaeraceae bacterium]|nr:hypothetical protein [Isosphaeraceae bacterium]